VNNSWLSL